MLEYLALPAQQIGDHLVARDAERFRRAVQIQTVTGLVLNLGQQNRLALQRRRPGQPVALRLHADDLGVRVLRNLPDQRAAVRLGHPVLGLNLLFGIDARLERVELLPSPPVSPLRGSLFPA